MEEECGVDVVRSSSVEVSVGEIGVRSGHKCAFVDAAVAACNSNSLARRSQSSELGVIVI